MSFSMKRGDLPAYTCVLMNGNQPMDLTGASVTFRMLPRGSSTPKIASAAAVVVGNPKDGRVTYQFAGTDSNTTGSFLADWRVIPPDGLPRTFPGDSSLQININP